jgi:apoptosis-inducing factor 3
VNDIVTTGTVDLGAGLALGAIPEGGCVRGHVNGDAAMLVRSGDSFFAVSPVCSHYGGPLDEGLVVGDTVRCPLHHACFSLRTGEALRAPALDPVDCWRVERLGDTVFVREKLPPPGSPAAVPVATAPEHPESVLILGGGAAGLAAVDMLRREGFRGALTMVSADAFPPCDRPNLSKDYLSGEAPDDWIPLRPPQFFVDRDIRLLLGTRAIAVDVAKREVRLEDGSTVAYGALLLATGAEPVALDIAGAPAFPIHYLRSYADSRAIVARAATAKRALIIGASFIGLEVAASLRKLGLEVNVAGLGQVPMERVLGAEIGRFVQGLHEAQGVRFHLGKTMQRVDGTSVTLSDGSVLEADLIVAGVGVRPALGLAEQAGLALDRGVAVDAYLQTSAQGVYAAGDIARWPDPHTGQRIRVEHWVVAERQGQVAALNMLGKRQRYEDVPFFWSQHYGTSIRYVGHAEGWDAIEIEGSLEPGGASCVASFKRQGRTVAVATIERDKESLQAQLAMELVLD